MFFVVAAVFSLLATGKQYKTAQVSFQRSVFGSIGEKRQSTTADRPQLDEIEIGSCNLVHAKVESSTTPKAGKPRKKLLGLKRPAFVQLTGPVCCTSEVKLHKFENFEISAKRRMTN